MRVLVVEDDCVSSEFLSATLTCYGYAVTTASNGREALELLRSGQYRIVVSDWEMPEMNGDELCRQVRAREWNAYVYIMLVTLFDGIDHVVEGLRAGADDFLSKPYHPEELRVRLRTAERILSLESRDVLLFAMAKLTESRDNDTGMHLDRIREYCRILAQELSAWPEYHDEIDGEYIQLLYLTSPLHDIGKVGIPDSVLLKPGPLTPEEFEVMKQHTTIGGETLQAVTMAHPEARYLSMARDIAFTHHERWDGSGYPFGLREREIPLCGRLTALADVYDALTSRRIYKAKMGHAQARQIIFDGSGSHFDPDVVEAFRRREDEFTRVANLLNASPEATAAPLAAAPPAVQPALV
ncbi:MAG: response regulator [Pirellulales bacterium]|nr:response regulator [Pirellulales bacterium]